MDSITLVTVAAGAAIALVVAGVSMALVKSDAARAEERLASLTSGKRQARARQQSAESLMKATPFDAQQMALLERFLPSPEKFRRLYEQADLSMPLRTFLMIAGAMAGVGVIGGALLLSPLLAPATGALMGLMPLAFLARCKQKRVAKFMASLPEAVELMSRALRAGHGLASGMQLVAGEMKGPIAAEFGRPFEEQNLGVPMDEALRGISSRIPTMDVRFLVTAIIIQRTTGGDLAEVLDKIGRLIRQRFELVGHVKSLTAEGRLSGLVLMALPPGLLAFIAMSNPDYVAPLFKTALGTKLLAVTVVLQLLGAVSVKKIISIQV